MHSSAGSVRRAAFLAVVMLASCAPAALAHALHVFAGAEGKTVSGEVYYSISSKARGVKVTALGPGGELLYETETDEQGRFSFEVETRCNLTIVARTGDGHRAEYVLHASELPPSLPLHSSEANGGGQAQAAPAAGAGEDVGGAQQERLVEEAIARQLRPLREQLDRYEHKVRLHDILGGIGYIVGLAGLVFFLRGRSRAAGGRGRGD